MKNKSDEYNQLYSVVYFNMPLGPTYHSKEYIRKYDLLNEEDDDYEKWPIEYIKIGQTTWDKTKHKTVYQAINKQRGGDKTGYPTTMAVIAYVVFPCKLKGGNIDKRVRQLMISFVNSFNESAEKNNFDNSSDYERHPECIDERFISSGTEFIYNVTKSEIIRTVDELNDLIEDGDKAIKYAKRHSKNSDNFLERLKDINDLIKSSLIEVESDIEEPIEKKMLEHKLAFDEDSLLSSLLFKRYKTYINSMTYDYIIRKRPNIIKIRELLEYFDSLDVYHKEIETRANKVNEYNVVRELIEKNGNLIENYYNENMMCDIRDDMNIVELIKKYDITI